MNVLRSYVKEFEDVFGLDAHVPAETTCCWCLMDEDEEYIHHQFFINITASIAMEISSQTFSDAVPQLGTTFYGSLFKHCSSRPLWISKDRRIRVSPPDGSMYYNFAWGNHAAKKTNNDANAGQEERNRARDKRHEQYICNRDRAFVEENFVSVEARRRQEWDLN